ncbi:hypothetical protein C3B47_14525 [Flavobacterium columnare]|uniref:Uncharacterized protein n=1 Tax=Flavobacterium columnare TaxID=996 RepID=A0A2T4HH79_9FLAO|nr:hypothetical protein [Flavobacterium columnare]MBF6654068.1 hypothetical protein [Flavobacterium columnare]MBF6654218.1 hypothetical protein [Flavobacterium columnare]MBF6658705.1 hypothetical protein [Flavobacterium columnare]MCH4830218.1 hypothetical protein [Flavobacterium columnare]MCH4832399.1 hypothetical protein [Flavobacterium columnare]
MKKIVLIYFSIIALNCKSQINKSVKNYTPENSMEIIDLEKIKKLEKDPDISGSGNYILENGDNLQINNDQNTIYVRIKKKNSFFNVYKEFFTFNKKIKKQIFLYDNFKYDFEKEYDKSGKLIKEINHNLPYKFSIEDLEKKMKTQYDVDIYDVKQIHSMNRYEEKKHLNIPLYEIWTNHKTNTLKFTCYIINGSTGETIYVGERFIEGKQGSLLDQYLNSKKN